MTLFTNKDKQTNEIEVHTTKCNTIAIANTDV